MSEKTVKCDPFAQEKRRKPGFIPSQILRVCVCHSSYFHSPQNVATIK